MPNAKVLESKKAVVETLSGKIKEATSIVFVDYKGINVAQDTDLRKQFREAGVEYTVVKNTLTRFATKENGYDFDEVLNGTTAMASTTGDPIAPARIVCEFAKKNKLPMAIKGGVVEGGTLLYHSNESALFLVGSFVTVFGIVRIQKVTEDIVAIVRKGLFFYQAKDRIANNFHQFSFDLVISIVFTVNLRGKVLLSHLCDRFKIKQLKKKMLYTQKHPNYIKTIQKLYFNNIFHTIQ